MPSDTDIYPPHSITARWTLLMVGVMVVSVGGYWLSVWLLTKAAIARQRRLANRQKPNAAQLIAEAVQRIEHIRSQLLAHTTSPAVASEELSRLTRQTFDALMNHRTLFLARYEIAARQLDEVAAVLASGYPMEFDAANQQPSSDMVNQLCDAARRAVESCN